MTETCLPYPSVLEIGLIVETCNYEGKRNKLMDTAFMNFSNVILECNIVMKTCNTFI